MPIDTNRAQLGLRQQIIDDLGKYFLVQNPTPGTGFAQTLANVSFSNTSAFITVYNGSGAQYPVPATATVAQRRIYLDYIRLICSVAGASTTSAHAVFALDTGNRYSSGTASTPAPTNLLLDPSQSTQSSVATIQVGPLVATAASANVIKVGRSVLRVAAAPAWVAFDEVLFHFGAEGVTEPQVVTAATASRIDVYMPPVIVAPNCTFLYQPYNVANATTAPSFEYEIGWWEF